MKKFSIITYALGNYNDTINPPYFEMDLDFFLQYYKEMADQNLDPKLLKWYKDKQGNWIFRNPGEQRRYIDKLGLIFAGKPVFFKL